MISVIIPAYNEEKNISKTLQSLVDQKYNKKFEVLLIDNNSTDKTSQNASKFSKKLNLKIINEKRQGRGHARATGAEKANGDILAFIDADTEATPNWLRVIDREFSKNSVISSVVERSNPLKKISPRAALGRNDKNDEQIVGLTGPWKVTDTTGFDRWFMENFQEAAHIPYIFVRGHYWLNGMNMAIRKSAYDKTDGFDRDMNAVEDVDITEKLRKFGKIKYSKKLLVKTSARRYKDGIIKGLWEYQKPWLEKHILGKAKINLPNIR